MAISENGQFEKVIDLGAPNVASFQMRVVDGVVAELRIDNTVIPASKFHRMTTAYQEFVAIATAMSYTMPPDD